MEPGGKWNDWTVKEYLGGGSSGKVYRIVKEEFGYTYESALKVIRIPQDPSQVEAVRSEGMSDEDIHSYFYSVVQSITSEFAILSQLSGSSNIVSYEDHYVSELPDGSGWEIFLRMELVTPLFEYLKEHTMSAEEVIRMGIDICKALELCRKNNIIHRDIKPGNIFYSKQGTFKLGDFGIARKLEKMESGMTKVGTESYMAPEIYRGQNYDAAVDVYSLGLILYQFFNNNRRPFMPAYPAPLELSDNEKANIKRMSGEPLPAPVSANAMLTEVICKACAFNAKDRYQDASKMRMDLEKVLEEADKEELSSIVYPYEGASASELTDKAYYDTETVTLFTGEAFPGVPKGSVDEHGAAPEQNQKPSSSMQMPKPSMQMQEPSMDSAALDNGKKHASISRALIAVIAAIILAAGIGAFSYFNHTVPDVQGMTYEKAEAAVKDAGLKIKKGEPEFSYTVKRGDIISQDVQGGAKLKKNSDVTVVVSKGKAINAPDLSGMEMSKAKKEAEKLGLDLLADASLSEFSDDVPNGHVIRQDIKAGAECAEGTVIKVILSKGPEQVKVPDVAAKAQAEAEKALEKAGFKVEAVTQYSNTSSRGTVISQTPAAGTKADKKSKVTIYVSAGRQPAASTGNRTTKKKTTKKSALKHAKGKKL